jgi:monoamine oxidase
MQTAKVAIVGAGISGLYAAYRLKQIGINDFIVLEARDRTGGRMYSVSAIESKNGGNKLDRFDLGPSWFWPQYQSQLADLIKSLGLESLEQSEQGDSVLQPSAQQPPIRSSGHRGNPISMRLVGGMAALTDALAAQIDASKIQLQCVVTSIRTVDEQVAITYSDMNGLQHTMMVEHVLLALPPRLATSTIVFEPPLPDDLKSHWDHMPTWMAPHAKYVAVYDQPFWREQGLSGQARSACGPLVEIHDASNPQGKAALFGFVGLPANQRQQLTQVELKSLCRKQLEALFGNEATTPQFELLQDWAIEPYTATAQDSSFSAQHAAAPPNQTATGTWRHRITGIGSEWSVEFPGYIAGAIDAASVGVEALLNRQSSNFPS